MTSLPDLLWGNLSAPARIWSALAPALLLGSYFVVGLILYLLRSLLRGGYRDAEMEKRGSSVVLGMWMRNYFAWVMKPPFALLRRNGIPPNAVTTLSVLLASAAAVAVAAGRFALGGWLYIFAGVCDFIDGKLARDLGRASPAGAALDSVLDRYAESVMFVGLAWYYRDSWVLIAVLAALVGSQMVSYIRARGEGLGLDVKVGIMQRPERLVVLGLSVCFAPVLEAWFAPEVAKPFHGLAVLGILVLAAATQLTAVGRLVHVLRKLSGKPLSPVRPTLGPLTAGAFTAAAQLGAEFALLMMLVTGSGLPAWGAVLLGSLGGSVAGQAALRGMRLVSPGPDLSRSLFIALSCALLTAGGVAVLLLLPGLDYRLAWLLSRLAVVVAWELPVWREYILGAVPGEPAPR